MSKTVDLLRLRARHRLKKLALRTLESNDLPEADELTELERLVRLVELDNRLASGERHVRWLVGGAFVVTLALVSVLVFARTPTTEVELELSVDDVTFELSETQILFDALRLTGLGASGLTRIDVPIPGGGERTLSEGAAGSAAIRVRTGGAQEQGSIDLGAYAAPEGTQVRIRYTGSSGHFRLTLTGAKNALQANILGPLLVAMPTEREALVEYDVPRSLRLKPSGGEVDLDLVSLDAAGSTLQAGVAISSLRLSGVDELATPNGTVVSLRSGIQGGTLFYESLNGHVRELRRYELLRFKEVQGTLRSVELAGDRIALQFRGSVSGMSAGSVSDPTSWMPTWLDWLRERQPLYLLWGTALYLFGLLMGAARWLGWAV